MREQVPMKEVMRVIDTTVGFLADWVKILTIQRIRLIKTRDETNIPTNVGLESTI